MAGEFFQVMAVHTPAHMVLSAASSIIQRKKEGVNATARVNGVESAWVILQHGYDGVCQRMSAKYLRRYMDAFLFCLKGGDAERDVAGRTGSLCDRLRGRRSVRPMAGR